MQKETQTMHDRIATIIWSVKMAISINWKVFIIWLFISVLTSLLPMISILYYQKIVRILSEYLKLREGVVGDCIYATIILGIIQLLIGVSQRINRDLIAMVMYDYYNIGMQEKIMDCVQQVEVRTLLSKQYSEDYKSMLNRAGALNDFMTATCLLIARMINIISLLIVSARISYTIAIISLIYLIVVMYINLHLAYKTQMNILKLREEERKIDLMKQQIIKPGVAKEMRIFGSKKNVMNQWENEYSKLVQMEKRSIYWKSIISFFGGLVFYIFIGVLIIYSINQIANDSMTVDKFLLLYTIGQAISGLIITISGAIQMSESCLFNLNHQRLFMENVPKMGMSNSGCKIDSKKDGKGVVLSVENLSFAYHENQEVLQNVSFEINEGETVAIVGCNGSGKSTLVKLMTKMYRPMKGSIRLYGRDYQEYSAEEISEQMGVYYQNSSLYHASIRENVGFGDVEEIENREKIAKAIQLGEAEKVVSKFEDGMEHWLLRYSLPEGAVLSGGEGQKILISRAYMNSKPFMIFDEPASALDPVAEMQQFRRIQSELSGRTSILISHRVSFARLADRILVLDYGRLIENGNHEQLMELNGVYAEFFREQAEWYDVKEA